MRFINTLQGGLAAPVSSVYLGMGNTVLIICFVVVVIGGIGSIRGGSRTVHTLLGHVTQREGICWCAVWL